MAFEWVNKGSCTDLSDLAKDSMWPTSQAAGNRQSLPDAAMTAPGSDPVDGELKKTDMADPHVDFSGPEIPVGTDGKPQADRQTSYSPSPSRWGPTTVPAVVRRYTGSGGRHG